MRTAGRHDVSVSGRLRLAAMAAVVCGAAACASLGAGAAPEGPVSASPGAVPPSEWRTTTHEHVDLWLHGYAMLSRDTASVPLFARGYRERMQAQKARMGITTMLDANRDRLAARLAADPALVNGQFVPLYFANFDEIKQVVPLFLRVDGNPGAASDPNMQILFSVLATSFPTAADRDWLRLFVQSLDDERTRFYDDHWRAEQARRAPVRRAVDSLWLLYRPKLERYLNNTQQASGEFILSLPLDGEGRTVTASKRENAVTTSFPDSPATAVDAIYVFAHEIVGTVVNAAIADNTTPAQQRSGIVAQYTANAAVRGGALLLQRTAPELAPGYMRHYLRETGATPPERNLEAAFVARFPLPDVIRDAIVRQMETVLGGI